MDIPSLEPIPLQSRLEALIRIPVLRDFIEECYRQILLREVDAPSLRRFSRRLRFLPFFSRRRFIRTLMGSDEHLQVLQHRLTKLEHIRQTVEHQQQALAFQYQQLARAEGAFELQRQVQEKQKIENQAERRHSQAIESLVLSKYEHLLQIDPPATFVSEAYQELLGRPPAKSELESGRTRLEVGVDRLKRDLLRKVLEKCHANSLDATVAHSSFPQPIHDMFRPRPSKGSACRVCEGSLTFKWSLGVLSDKYMADYYECLQCRALQIPHPYWLDEAYESENAACLCNPDTSRFMRNFSTYRYLAALAKAQVFPEQPQFLDFAGGYGLLTQMLHSAGHKAWLTDLYVSTPYFASDRYIRDFQAIPENSFDVITALEVFEHLTEPIQVVERLRRILKPEGTLVISTSIYRPSEHDSNWVYLARPWGQHVTFWSQEALEACAAKTGFRSVGYFPSDEGVLILFSMDSVQHLKDKLAHGLRLLQDIHHFREVICVWDFLTRRCITLLEEPEVREVDIKTAAHEIAA